MKKRLFLVRHGQTDFNLKGIIQGGGVDSSINEKGREQAQAFFEKYKNEDFIYTIAELPYLSHPLELFAGPYSDKYRLASYNYLSILEDNKYKNTYNVGTHGGYFLCCWNLKSNGYSIKLVETSIASKNVSGPRQIITKNLIDYFDTPLYEGFIIPVSTLTLAQYRKNSLDSIKKAKYKYYFEVFLTLETSLELEELRNHFVAIYAI